MFSTEELAALDRSYFSVICADAYDVTIMLFYRLIDIVFFTLFNPIFMLHKVLMYFY